MKPSSNNSLVSQFLQKKVPCKNINPFKRKSNGLFRRSKFVNLPHMIILVFRYLCFSRRFSWFGRIPKRITKSYYFPVKTCKNQHYLWDTFTAFDLFWKCVKMSEFDVFISWNPTFSHISKQLQQLHFCGERLPTKDTSRTGFWECTLFIAEANMHRKQRHLAVFMIWTT